MPKRSTSEDSPQFSPAMLKWAREWRDTSLEDAANAVNKTPSQIRDWEADDGETFPTVIQARKLAKLYRRPFLELFMVKHPEPARPQLVPDFRLYHDAPDPSEDRDFLDVQEWAESLRNNALSLYEELGEKPPQFPQALMTDISSSPEEYAAMAREISGFTLREQSELKANETYKLPDLLKSRIESLGVLVARANSLKRHKARGLCLAEQPLPVIVYSKEAPSAQAFTIIHELGHIMTGESGIIGPYVKREVNHAQAMESWCNKFAAAFFMPADAVANLIAKPSVPAREISDEALDDFAKFFRLSAEATLIRLVHLGYVRPSYYWEDKYPEYREADKNYKQFGRSKFYSNRFRNRVGDSYTGLVLEAWESGKITGHNAAEYMGIKKLDYLYQMKDRFQAQ